LINGSLTSERGLLIVPAQVSPRKDHRTYDAASEQHALEAAGYYLAYRPKTLLAERAADLIEPET